MGHVIYQKLHLFTDTQQHCSAANKATPYWGSVEGWARTAQLQIVLMYNSHDPKYDAHRARRWTPCWLDLLSLPRTHSAL